MSSSRQSCMREFLCLTSCRLSRICTNTRPGWLKANFAYITCKAYSKAASQHKKMGQATSYSASLSSFAGSAKHGSCAACGPSTRAKLDEQQKQSMEESLCGHVYIVRAQQIAFKQPMACAWRQGVVCTADSPLTYIHTHDQTSVEVPQPQVGMS